MEDQLVVIIADLKQDIGRVLEGQKNLSSYIENVSRDQKEQAHKHDEHVEDDMAHGFRVMRRTLVSVGSCITLAIGVFEFFMHKK